MTHPQYTLVAKRAKHRCEYCHAPEIIFNLAFEVDHIVPREHLTFAMSINT
jgi:pyruvate-formate lyase-activating enzyme